MEGVTIRTLPRRVVGESTVGFGRRNDVSFINRSREATILSRIGDPPVQAPLATEGVEMIFLGSASLSTTTPKNGDIISSHVISP